MIWEIDKAVLVFSVLSALISSVIPYIGILLSAFLIDGLYAGQELVSLILSALCAVAGILVLSVLGSYLDQVKELHTELCVKKFDMEMSVRTLTMDYELLESPAVNEIRTRIRNDHNWGAGFYSMIWQLPDLLSGFISLIISVVVLIPLFIEGRALYDISSLVMLLVFLGIVLCKAIYSAKLRKKLHCFLDEGSANYDYIGYYLWNKQDYKSGKDIRIFGAQKLIESHLQDSYDEKKVWINKIVGNNCKSGFTDGFCTGLLQMIAYLFVALRAVAGALTIGSVLKYAATIYQFSSALSQVFSSFAEYGISAERQQSTLEYMNIPDVLPKGSLSVDKPGGEAYEIAFHNVSFRYPGSERYSLENLNIEFTVGKKMAVVGMNGSGKTTMIKLLCRLYDPTEGKITLNGVDIREYDYREYTRIFSVVFQDFKLLSFTLGQNVAGSVDYDQEKAERCLREAGFKDRLETLPKGLETCLYKDYEEEGIEISGGEAQKLAIARALYQDAPIIVLDEPTAALDPLAEYELYSKFDEVIGNKTAIYISHRLSSCRFCDDIAVFDEGRLVQRGRHDELVADVTGKYYALWNAQAQYYAQDVRN